MSHSPRSSPPSLLSGAATLALAAMVTMGSPLQAQAQDWSGRYIGGLVGYADGTYTSEASAEVDHEPTGQFFGVLAGVSRSHGSLFFGIEADFALSSIEGEDVVTVSGFTSDVSHAVNYLGTLRARVGKPIGPALVYGTGGLAVADLDNTLVVTAGGAQVGRDEIESWHMGWTAGVGAEVRVTPAVSLAAEYLRIDMGREEISADIGGFPFDDSGDLNLNTFRVALRYYF